MKKIITIHQLEAIKQLTSLADGFVVGNKRFGTRLTTSFTKDEINRAIKQAYQFEKDIFLMANRMFDDDDCQSFEAWLSSINTHLLTGIIVADIGALSLLSEMGLADKVVYHPETLLTNRYDTNSFAKDKILGAFVAKEITLEEIRHIGFGRKLKLFMVGHGYLDMFYSRRQLIETFTIKAELDHQFHDHKHLTLIEAKRDQEPYPILEDDAGTHVFRYRVFCSAFDLKELEQAVDYLFIDTIFHDDQYAEKILKFYDAPSKALQEEIMNEYQEAWDDGFLHKPTMYQVKGDKHD